MCENGKIGSGSGLTGELPPLSQNLLVWDFNKKLGYDSAGLNTLDRALTPDQENGRLLQSNCIDIATTNNSVLFADLSSVIPVAPTEFTIMVFYKKTGANTGYDYLFQRGVGGSYTNAALSFPADNQVGYSGGNGLADITYTIPVGNNQGVHSLAISYDRTEQILFYDGQNVGSKNNTAVYNIGNPLANLGSAGTALHVYWAAVWSSKLSPTQIQEIHDNCSNIKQYAPDFWVPCSEGLGDNVYDVSGNGNHGSRAGLAWTTQDECHYNIIYGYRESTGVKIPALADGTASADGNTITNPSREGWHNGAETKFVLSDTFDGTGWEAYQTVKDNDPAEIFHVAATGYARPLGYSDFEAVFGSGVFPEYAYSDVSVENQYKNLLIYKDGLTPTFNKSVALYDFIGQKDNLLKDVNGNFTFDVNGFPTLEVI